MTQELIVLRHGEASAPAGRPDFERTLTALGRQQVAAVARLLAPTAERSLTICSSPAARTRETTEIVCGSVGYPLERVVWEPQVYNASLEILIDVVTEHRLTSERLLLVGHNPSVTYLLDYLCGSGAAERGLSTGSFARIELAGEPWDRGIGRLIERIDPSGLEA